MGAGQGGRPGGPLGQCGLCQGVFPEADLSFQRGGNYCGPCTVRRADVLAGGQQDEGDEPRIAERAPPTGAISTLGFDTIGADPTPVTAASLGLSAPGRGALPMLGAAGDASGGFADDPGAALGPATGTARRRRPDKAILKAAWQARYQGLSERLLRGFPSLEDILAAAEAAEKGGLVNEAVAHYRDALGMVPGHPLARARLRELEPRDAHPIAPEPDDVPFGRTQRRQSEDPPFWADLGKVIGYPFHGKGKAVLAAASVFFAVADVIAQVSIVGFLVFICMWGYVVAYQFDVISATAAGKDDPPEFPEVSSILESMVFPLFAWIACGTVSFLPFWGVVIMGMKGVLPGAVLLPLGLITFAAGFFVFPMSLTVRALFQSLGPAVSPRVVLSSIGRIFPDYLAAFVAIGAIWVAFSLVNGIATIVIAGVVGAPTAEAIMVMDVARIFGWLVMTFVKWPLLLIAIMLEAHVLGKMYRQAQVRLAWFVQPTDATVRAHKMSATLALCAILAGVLVTGGAWFTWNLLDVATTGVSAVKTKCPIRDGSSLTYYWENTDGPAGLVRYDFRKLPTGDLQVLVSTQIAGFDDEMGEPTEFSAFDPDTNTWTKPGQAYLGEVTMSAIPGAHVPFYGPVSARVGGNYVNTSQVKESTRWSKTWDVWRVVFEGSGTDYYYDQGTGLLVGKGFKGVGFQVSEWLTSVENMPNVGDCPPPNRNFGD